MDQVEGDVLEALFNDNRVNAGLSWLLVGVLAIVAFESLLDRDFPWIVFTAATGAIVLVPPVTNRSLQVMLPWELLALATLPILVRGLGISAFANTFSTYLSIAALALVVTVELHLLARMRITHWFAVLLVVVATLATAALWALVRWFFDAALGAAFLDGVDNDALMIEFVWVTLAGVAGGVLFDLYFRPRMRGIRRRVGGVVRR